jgi:DNA repair exonuclease SbcCD ATPase subunit
MKIINTADIHTPDKRRLPEWYEKAMASLTTLAETVERERPTLVTIAGDLHHGGIQNTSAAGFPAFESIIQRILRVCPIAAVSGTQSHDPPGAYEALTKLKAAHSFILLDPSDMSPPVAWIREDGKIEVEIYSEQNPVSDVHTAKLMIMGLPEPTRDWLLAGENGVKPEQMMGVLREKLRGILLGLGAIRAQYPEIPCEFLGHFPFSGASMQNGQTVGASEIVLGREDLQLIAPDITARYPGNAYPKEWGELGQVGFDMVDLQPGDTYGNIGHIHLAQEIVHGRDIAVKRFNYPHPPSAKYVLGPDECTIEESIRGKQVWVVLRRTSEQMAHGDDGMEDTDQDTLEALGAAPGSRVTIEIIPTEKVRAPEIVQKRRLREKVVVNAEAAGETVIESILLKADQLERETEAQGVFVDSAFRVRKMRARGLKGIYKGRRLLRRLLHLPGLPLDDVTLDFDAYGPGALAMIGPTGSGKTTLLRFLAPYSDMPGRPGPLRNYFRLRDSAWELWLVDERTGDEYRLLTLIDGANASGTTEYHLYRNGEPVPREKEKQGDDFDYKTRRIFGSPELFVRTSYVAQKTGKDNPDLSEATKGERKAIFRELAGLDYLQKDSENAGAKRKAGDEEIEGERVRLNLVESQLTALPGIRADRSERMADLDGRRVALAELESRSLSLKADVEALASRVKEQEALTQRIAGLEDQAAQKRQVIAEAGSLIAGYAEATKQAPEAQKIVDEWTRLSAEEGKENERIAKINTERARLSAEYGNTLKAHSANVKGIEASRTRLRAEKARLEADLRVLGAQIDTLAGNLKQAIPALVDSCPRCGQKLPPDLLAVEQNRHADEVLNRAEMEKNLTISREKLTETAKSIETKQAEIDAIKDPTPPMDKTPVEPSKAELQRITTAIAALKIVDARQTLATAQEAAVRTEEARKQGDLAQSGLTILEINLTDARRKLDPSIVPAHEAAVEKYEQARRDYAAAREGIVTLEAQIKEREQRITELEAQERDLAERRTALKTKQAEADEWRYMERACGPDGIQALEIDAMGPGIAQTANDLLSSVFGSRFSVDFRTTRIAGKGAKTHQVEDFAIWIIDNEDNGSEQEFFTLSGGESVPVRLAIYEAFAKARAQKFSPMIIDEADGSLDPSLRAGYVEMIERAREQAGRRNTILISHDTTVQEMVGQKIVMAELAGKEKEEAAA